MIAGEVVSYVGDADKPEVDTQELIELTDWSSDPFIEIAADVGKRRVYFKFRISDLLREIKEQSRT